MRTALMLHSPRRDADHCRGQKILPLLATLLMKSDLLIGRRPELLAANALTGLLAIFDEARQFMHSAVLRPAIERGVIDARFTCWVSSHRSKMHAPIGCEAGITFDFRH
ncbi:MAG: hypothetical protein WBX25_15215 [Rhodomicrobium sp.]